MAARPYQVGRRSSDVRNSIYVDEIFTIDGTANTPVGSHTQPPLNMVQRNCERRDVTKKRELKWLVFAFVAAAVIVILIAILITKQRAGNDQHGENQKTKILVENLKLNLTSRINEVKVELSEMNDRFTLMEAWDGVRYTASNGLSYKRFTAAMNFEDAEKRCGRVGARLASTGIRDKKVWRELQKANVVSSTNWIGLKETVNSEWAWSDGAAYSNMTTPWAASQPNDDGDCALTYSSGGLYDRSCGSLFQFICERQV